MASCFYPELKDVMESKHNLFALLYFIMLDLGGLAAAKAHL